jgi:putative transposase
MVCNELEKCHRLSLRLKGYDYTQPGAYFVTICTQDRICLFETIVDGKMNLNEAGQMVEKCWKEIPTHFPHVVLDQLIIMPNHVHGILFIVDLAGAKIFRPAGIRSLVNGHD